MDIENQEFDMYSGYLEIGSKTKKIHYLFVESQFQKENSPVIIYLSGGIGCSVLHSWAMATGPFIMKDGEERFEKGLNPYSWNNNANVLYLESVIGAGFSFPNAGYDPKITHTDDQVAKDAYEAIKVW
jgi:carboxypeptidase C (cathepsin A)